MGNDVFITTIWKDNSTLVVEIPHRKDQKVVVVKDQRPDTPRMSRSDVLRALEHHFVTITGIPLPPRETAKERKAAAALWWHPLKQLAELHKGDIAETRRLMNVAVDKMREDQLTISAPKSIISVALDEFGKAQSKEGRGVQVW